MGLKKIQKLFKKILKVHASADKSSDQDFIRDCLYELLREKFFIALSMDFGPPLPTAELLAYQSSYTTLEF